MNERSIKWVNEWLVGVGPERVAETKMNRQKEITEDSEEERDMTRAVPGEYWASISWASPVGQPWGDESKKHWEGCYEGRNDWFG